MSLSDFPHLVLNVHAMQIILPSAIIYISVVIFVDD